MRYKLLNGFAVFLLGVGVVATAGGLTILPLTFGPAFFLVAAAGVVVAASAPFIGTAAEQMEAVAATRDRYNRDGEKSPKEEYKALRKKQKSLKSLIYSSGPDTVKQDRFYLELIEVEAELERFKTTRKVKI